MHAVSPLQYARKMGFTVVAVGRGGDIVQDALALGAHGYVDTKREDAVARRYDLDGAQARTSSRTWWTDSRRKGASSSPVLARSRSLLSRSRRPTPSALPG